MIKAWRQPFLLIINFKEIIFTFDINIFKLCFAEDFFVNFWQTKIIFSQLIKRQMHNVFSFV